MNDQVEGNAGNEDANLGLGFAIGFAGCMVMACSCILGVVLGGWLGLNLYDGSGKPPEVRSYQQFGSMIAGGLAGGIILPSAAFLVAWFVAFKQLAKPRRNGGAHSASPSPPDSDTDNSTEST